MTKHINFVVKTLCSW